MVLVCDSNYFKNEHASENKFFILIWSANSELRFGLLLLKLFSKPLLYLGELVCLFPLYSSLFVSTKFSGLVLFLALGCVIVPLHVHIESNWAETGH